MEWSHHQLRKDKAIATQHDDEGKHNQWRVLSSSRMPRDQLPPRLPLISAAVAATWHRLGLLQLLLEEGQAPLDHRGQRMMLALSRSMRSSMAASSAVCSGVKNFALPGPLPARRSCGPGAMAGRACA
jgi:hypothetical protein